MSWKEANELRKCKHSVRIRWRAYIHWLSSDANTRCLAISSSSLLEMNASLAYDSAKQSLLKSKSSGPMEIHPLRKEQISCASTSLFS